MNNDDKDNHLKDFEETIQTVELVIFIVVIVFSGVVSGLAGYGLYAMVKGCP